MISKSVQHVHLSYAQNGKDAAISPPSGQQLAVFLIAANNRTASAKNVGICKLLPDLEWKLWTFESSAAAVEVTTSIQAGSNQDLFGVGANSGFIFQSSKMFNLVGFSIATGETGSPVYVYEYWNGTSWATLPTVEKFMNRSTSAEGFFSGDQVATFMSPHDWVQGTDVTTDADSAMYSIRVRASTLPSTIPVADDAWVAQFIDYQDSLNSYGSLVKTFPVQRPLVLESQEAIMPYFSGVASSDNVISADYVQWP